MSKPFFLAAICLVLASCQTTKDDVSLVDRYDAAFSCMRSHVETHLTSQKETPDEIRELVYAGIRNCDAQVVFYIDGIIDQTLFDLRWNYVSDEGRANVRTNVLVTTSLILQKQFNDLETKS